MKLTFGKTVTASGGTVARRGRSRVGKPAMWRRVAGLLAVAGCAALTLQTGAGSTAADAAARPADVIPAPRVEPNPQDITADQAGTCATAAYKAGWPMDQLISTQEGTYDEIVIATAIGMAESTCDAGAINGSGSCAARGMWQIEQCYWPDVSENCLMNAQCNGDASHDYVYADDGFCAWQSFDIDCGNGYNGSWANYISDAEEGVSSLTFRLQNQGTGECLAADASEAENGGAIWQYNCASANLYGDWHLVQGADDLNPVLQNEGTGYCLDTEAGQAYNSGTIFQWTCNSGDAHQRWYVVPSSSPNDNDNAELNLKDSENATCLAADASEPVNDGLIWQWDCSGYSTNAYLKWN